MSDANLSIHSILCPTDFSEFAASAFAESVRLARWFGAKVTLLHVIPFPAAFAGDMGYVPMPAEAADEARSAALVELRRFADATEHTGVPVEIECRDGDVCGEIRKAAQDSRAELVVLGTHGRSGFKWMVLGSVTEGILNHPPVPVLTVNRQLPRRNGLYRTVLCAVDVSEWSEGTVSVALAIAGDGAQRLTVLNVVEHGAEASGGELEHTALTALRELIPEEARTSFRIDEHVAFGEPDREILREAAEERADLVVLGARGIGAFRRLFGSTASRVVRAATCPVLVVPVGHAWPVTGLVRREVTPDSFTKGA